MNTEEIEIALEELAWDYDPKYIPRIPKMYPIKAFYYYGIDKAIFMLTISHKEIRILEKGYTADTNVPLFRGELVTGLYHQEIKTLMKQLKIV